MQNININLKMIFLALVICFVLMIGSVSAADSNTLNGNLTASDTVSFTSHMDDSDECISLESNGNENTLSNEYQKKAVVGATGEDLLSDEGNKTLTDLKNEIDNAVNAKVQLNGKYYKYNSSIDSSIVGVNKAIAISNIEIDGNGATIDGDNQVYPFQSNGNLILKNINFVNILNKNAHVASTHEGGVIVFSSGSSNIIIENCNFTNIKKTTNGAGVLGFPNGKNILIKKCNFNNTNTVNAIILLWGNNMENLTIEDSTFDNIATTVYNGVFYAQKSKNFKINNNNFSNVKYVSGSLLMFIDDSASIISNCNFYNTLGTYAVIRFEKGNGNTVINCNFNKTHRSDDNSGRGIAILILNGANILIDNCNISDIKHAGGYGGGITIGAGAGYKCQNITINHCNFHNITISYSGVGIYTGGHNKNNPVSDIKIYNCNFNRGRFDYSGSRGSAIELNANHAFIINCTFTNNYAGGSGALGLFSTATYCTIINCTFINNTAKQGGAISLEQEACHDAHIINCTFINNTAKAISGDKQSGGGGAIAFYASKSLINNCTFINNTASEGGAIQFKANNCNVTDCDFIGNNALAHGGGIYFAAHNSYVLRCDFINNTANTDGGGMCSQAPKGSISYVEASKFIGNKAPTGTDFYSHPGSQIKFIGLKFNVLWLTNDNEMDEGVESSVLNGYGTWYDKPARWDSDAMDFLNTEGGKITIYLVGDITSFDEKMLNIPNFEIIGYDKDTNPVGATVDLSGWNHRAFTVAATNIMFKNILFKNSNLASGDGGVIKVSSSRVSQIRNCTFINNTATYGGAVSFNNTVHNGIFIVNDSTFKMNKALIHGGALYFDNSSDFTTILETVIQDNRIITNSSENAAAYYQSRMNITSNPLYYFLDSFSIDHERNNSDTNNPINTNHGILCREDVYVSLSYAFNPGRQKGNGTSYNDTTDFISGIALVKATGGTIHFLPNEIYTLEDIRNLEPGFNWYVEFFKFNIFIEGNNCTFSNFGLQSNVDFGSNIHFMNLTFKDYRDFHPIINDGMNNVIESCKFINNNKISVINNGGNLKIINTTFMNNNVVAVSSNASNMTIINSLFDKNPTHMTIDAGGNFTQIIDSKFVNATQSAVVVNASDVNIVGSNFTHNTGVNGGAIYLINGSLILKGNNFTYNTAVNGGALYLENGTVVNSNDNKFYYNNATKYGGAIYTLVPINLNADVFVGNNASIGGGAIYLNATGSNISNVKFINNWAVNGSAIYLVSSNKLFVNNVVCERNTQTDFAD